MPIVIETIDEFTARNGNDAIPIDRGARLLFSNGATMSAQDGQVRSEPPTDPTAKLRAKRLYIRTKLNQADKSFYQSRKALLDQGDYALRSPHLPPPDERAIKHLDKLRDDVADLVLSLEEVDAKLAQTPAAIQARDLAEWEAKRKDAVRDQINRIQNITLEGEAPPTP